MTTSSIEPAHTDGNSAAGALAEVFAVDVSAAEGVCVACGRACRMAQARLYGRGPGLVLRCPGCDQVLLRWVTSDHDGWLDLSGVRALRVERAPQAERPS